MFSVTLIALQKEIMRPDGQTISTVSIDHIIKKLMDTADITPMEK